MPSSCPSTASRRLIFTTLSPADLNSSLFLGCVWPFIELRRSRRGQRTYVYAVFNGMFHSGLNKWLGYFFLHLAHAAHRPFPFLRRSGFSHQAPPPCIDHASQDPEAWLNVDVHELLKRLNSSRPHLGIGGYKARVLIESMGGDDHNPHFGNLLLYLRYDPKIALGEFFRPNERRSSEFEHGDSPLVTQFIEGDGLLAC